MSNDELQALALRARGGDDEAFTELVVRVYPTMFRWALVRLRDSDDAEDLVQRALVSAHRGLPQYRAESQFLAWLFRIVDRAAADHWRVTGRRLRMLGRWRDDVIADAAPTGVSAHDATSEGDLGQLVRRYLGELPARQRQVLDLVDLQDFSPSEVATMLGMEPVTVRASLFKARRALRLRILGSHPEYATGPGGQDE